MLFGGLHADGYACRACDEAEGLRRGLATVTNRIHLEEIAPVQPGQEGPAAPPPWIRAEPCPNVRFLGAPLGYPLDAFVEFLLTGGDDPQKVPEVLRRVAGSMARRHHLRLFLSREVRDAPGAMRSCVALARLARTRTELDVIDVRAFPEMATRFRVRMLPVLCIDQSSRLYPDPDLSEFARALADRLPDGGWPPAEVP
jgi:alkyl hydroperoxide reductase subunit AhpF